MWSKDYVVHTVHHVHHRIKRSLEVKNGSVIKRFVKIQDSYFRNWLLDLMSNTIVLDNSEIRTYIET